MASNKKTGLGRGLEAIFLDNTAEEVREGITILRVSDVEPNADQPRKAFDNEALQALADSIAANGLLQPILVRESGNGFYKIVAGERRWRACKMAGLTELPAIVMEIDDKKAAEIALIENIQRKDLNAMEEAAAYRALLDEYHMTQEEISQRLGISRSALANTVRLLDLPQDVADLVAKGQLSAGHARTLLGLLNRSDISRAAQTILSRSLSVRETEALVKALNKAALSPEEEEEPVKNVKVDYLKELERAVTAQIGRRVKVQNKGKVHRVEIEFTDNEDLDALMHLLCGKNPFGDA